MKKVNFFIKITLEFDEDNPCNCHFDDIGEFLAYDIANSLDNGEDFVETEYLGGKIL